MHYAWVAARTMEAAPHLWELVADAVHNRRTELGLSAKQLVDRAGPGLSVAVLSLVENARQTSYTVRTMRALCRGLEWTDDSIQRILDGGEPEAVRLLTPSQEERLAALERQVAELWAEVNLAKLTAERERLSVEASAATARDAAKERAERAVRPEAS